MYFEPQVKEKKEDFFNFEVLQNELKKALEDKTVPLIAVSGLRRTGKTSLIRVVLNSLKKKYVWMDGRSISSQNSFFRHLMDETEKLRTFKIKGIAIKGVEIGLDYSRKGLDYLNKHKAVLVVDEAQLLKRMRLDNIIAFIYDNYPAIKIVLSGSEVGMLMNFLGKNNAKAPLYGRAVLELQTHRLDEESANLFLSQGAKQAKIILKEEEVNEAIKRLDGIIGWLTKYGWLRLRNGHKGALKKAIEEGKVVAREEFLKFAAIAEGKYKAIMKALKDGGARWNEIKQQTSISDKQLYSALKRLADCGFIEKKEGVYTIADPLLETAIQ